MRIRPFILIGMAALLAVGCSKQTAHKAALREELSIAADLPVRDLGVVELSAGTPKLVRLGPGRDLTLTASVITNGMLQMSLAYESKSETAEGSPVRTTKHYTQHSQFMLPAGKPCAVTLNGPAPDHLAVVMRPILVTP